MAGFAVRRIGVAVVATMVVAACSGDEGSVPPTPTAATTTTATTVPAVESTTSMSSTTLATDGQAEWTVPADGLSVDITDDLSIEIPAGAITPGATLRVEAGSPGEDALTEMSSAGDAVLLEVDDGVIESPVALTFDVPPPAEGETPIVARWDGSTWIPIGGTYDPATGTVTVLTDQFSWWKPWTWNIGNILRSTFTAFFGDVDTRALDCASEPTPGYLATLTNAESAFSGCAKVADGELEITIKNRRRGAFVIELAKGWNGEVVDAFDFSSMLTESLYNSTSRRFLVVPGGETAVIRGTLAPGGRASMPVSQDLFSWSIDTLLYALSVYSVGSKAAGSVDDLSSVIRQTEDRLSQLRDGLTCLQGNANWLDAAVNRPNSAEAIEDLAPTIWQCAKTAFRDGAAGVIALLVDLVLTPFRQIYKLGEMAVDIARGVDNRRLVINGVDDSEPADPIGSGDATVGGEISIAPLGGGKSSFSDDYFADVAPPVSTGRFTISVPFTATGRSDLRRPETSCLEHSDGWTAVPLGVELSTDSAGSFAGSIEFAVIVPGTWSFRYSCTSDYTAVPVAEATFSLIGLAEFSDRYYSTVLTSTVDASPTVVDLVAQGHSASLDDLRDPATSCLVAPDGTTISASATSYGRVVDGYYYEAQLTFDATAGDGWSFRYSCETDYTDVALGGAPSSGTSTGSSGSPNEWPTSAGLQGPSVLSVFLGSQLVIPSWISCTDDDAVCLVGTGDAVEIYVVDGLRRAAVIPIASSDPTAALRDIGMTAPQVREMLSP